MRSYYKTALVVFLVLCVISLTFGIFSKEQNKATQDSYPTPTSVAQSQLFFSPATTNFPPGKPTTIDVVLDTGSNNVTGVQLEIRYDSSVISNLSISPGPFLTQGTNKPENLINKIDLKNGRGTYALVLPLSLPAVKGKGVIATLSVTQRTPLQTPESETTIHLLHTSLVTAEGIRKSVLKSADSATLTLSK